MPLASPIDAMRVLRTIASGFLLVATSCATSAEFGYSSAPGYYDPYYDAGYPYAYDLYPYYPYAPYAPFAYYGSYPYAGYHGSYPMYRYQSPPRNVTIARPPQYSAPPAAAPPAARPSAPAAPPSTTIARPPGR
jgi:hypothetical protein